MTFPSPGYVPTGWKRGQPLQVRKYGDAPHITTTATIWLDVPRLPMDPIPEVACLAVPRGEEAKADEWLAWWREK